MIDITSVMLRFRRRRMQQLASLLRLTPTTTVLDVGGTPLNWSLLDVTPRLTLLNMPRASADIAAGNWVGGDGRMLPFRDQSFDLVFSNSVIEHVGSPANQRAFAREVARVGRRYWVQTPNRHFPVEPHLLTPFIHFLPRSIQGHIVKHWTVWSMLTRPSRDRRDFYIHHYLNDIRLLSRSDLAELFPDGRIIRERFAGATKSLIAAKL